MAAELTLEQIYDNLCSKDPRNPLFECIYGCDEPDEVPAPRVGCSWDNCFYRRDRLAREILRLRGLSEAETA